KKILISFLISTIASIAWACTGDYECGKGYPYAACNGGLNVYPGIAYDGNFNLLIAGKFNSTHNGPFGVSAMFNIPITTLDGEIHKKFDIRGEVEEGSGSFSIFRFLKYLPQPKYYYFIMNQAGAPIFSILTENDHTITQIWNIHNTPFTIDFIESEKITVYSAYGIYKINNIPTKKSDSDGATLLYQNQIVNGLAIDQQTKKDIYMSTYDGTLLKGSIDCSNCTQDKLIKIGQDANAAKLTDFIESRGMIYYSYNGGISKISVDGNSTAIQIVKDENVVALTEFNGIVYFLTSDGVVKSVLSDSDNLKRTIYTPTSDHQCQPAVGFQDLNGTCTGTVLWGYKGIPRCVPNKEGSQVPEICYTESQCSNTQFFRCVNSKCECLENFYGANCESCDGKVEYIYNGIPTC
ncbi:hypothetical protein DICPUDRAFT_18468, partial [Dictyostelium purpureum]